MGRMFLRSEMLAALLAVATGCMPLSGGWEVGSLRERHAEVLARPGQRLGDTAPYFIPHGTSVVLFLCRFAKQSPISVSFPSDASAREVYAIQAALEGWSNAGLGIRFEGGDADSAMIDIRFVETPVRSQSQRASTPGTGYTVTDCGFDSGWGVAAEAGELLPARLTRAVIRVRRSNNDMLGREVALGEDELVGVVLHELGHALGFPGHVATPDSVMAESTDTVRRFGRRLRAGRGFAAPSLAALYALPSGTVVGRRGISAEQAALFTTAVELARSRDWHGPFVRVGERHANLNWRVGGRPAGTLEVRGYREALRLGQPLFFSTSPFERALRGEMEPAR